MSLFIRMKKSLHFFSFAILSIILAGCASPQVEVSTKFQQCRAIYSSKTGKEICRSYWTNLDISCDEAMRSIMGTAINSDACRAERPSVSQSTNQNLNQSRSSVYASCQSKYSRANSQIICQSYWSNSDQQCDQAMREIVESRGISILGNSCFGNFAAQQRPANSSNANSILENNDKSSNNRLCRRDYLSTPTNILCQSYWLNTDQKCDTAIREIISERGVNITSGSCYVERVNLNSNSNTASSIDNSTNNKLILPKANSARCESFIRNIALGANPIESACRLRYNSLQEETIFCRKELNSLINDNSKGVGTSTATCGAKQ